MQKIESCLPTNTTWGVFKVNVVSSIKIFLVYCETDCLCVDDDDDQIIWQDQDFLNQCPRPINPYLLVQMVKVTRHILIKAILGPTLHCIDTCLFGAHQTYPLYSSL